MKGENSLKINTDCIRNILITVESMDYGEEWIIDDLMNQLPSYSEAELQYHCLQLIDAGFLNASTIQSLNSPLQILRIKDLTYSGHQFLADIRSDTTWNKTKEIAKSIGSESLHALKDIAISVVTSSIQNSLGLH